MNFKKYHESRNLWNAIKYSYTSLSENNVWVYSTSLTGSVYRSPCKPNTTYTLYLAENVDITIWRIREVSTDVVPNASSTSVPTTRTYASSVPASKSATFTTSASAQYILFQTNESAYDSVLPVIMLIEGNTKIPYEPYSSEVWHDIPYYTHKTATDTLTLPAVIYPNDTSITVGLKGNTVQSGTPTPDNTVMPEGTGERTGNLAQWEKGGINTSTGADEVYRTAAQGGTCEQMRSLYVPCSGNTSYVLHSNHYPVQTFISYYDADKNYISRSSGAPQGDNRVFRTPETARYMRAQLAHVVTDQVYPAIEENQQYAITFGSTPLPYEPYGYKIPILSANTTTNIYLGEVQTTRRIKKLVLTGQETRWYKSGAYQGSFYLGGVSPKPISLTEQAYCSHAEFTSISTYAKNKFCFNGSPINLNLWIGESSWTTDDFKAYLAQQYAAGTPVTIWYVLATEETGIVNEPLMKIGNYADEIINISIPTIVGTNTFDVDTTVQPSEVTLHYHGWHPINNVHEHDNGEWN